MPKLVFALESDYQGPMCLNEDNTLGITNFAYSEPYTINGFDYIDELFIAPNGIIYARILFINNLEAPQELSSQRHYYKLAEVVQYPIVPDLVITAATVHDNIAFNPWILQNWVIAKEEQDRLNMEQWQSIQFFMQQEYRTEQAALDAYHAGMEVARANRKLQKLENKIKHLKIENAAIKAKMKLNEDTVKKKVTFEEDDNSKATASVSLIDSGAPSSIKEHSKHKKSPIPIEPKLSKAQKQKNRRDDILLKASRIAALAIMVTKTYSKILDLLKVTQILNTQDRIFFTTNLNISINSCGYILNKLHKRTDVSSEVKLAFLYKLDSYSKSELSEYTQNNHVQTQNLVTMAAELGADAALRTKIQTLNNNILAWNNNIQTVKRNQAKLLDELQKYFKSKEAEPELLLQQSILDLNSSEFLAIINNHAELNKKSTSILKTLLPSLSSSESNKLKQFLDDIKLSKDVWRDIYGNDKISGTVKTVTQQWANTEAQAIFESITRKTNPVKIPKQLIHLFNDKTTTINQTLLMLAFAKAYPDDILEQIFIHAPGNLLTIDWDDQTILHYMARYYKGNNYELIRRIRDAFIQAIEDAKQHFPEMIQMQSDKDGGTFLHYILQGENESHACKMLRLFLTDETLPTQLRKIFGTTIFARNYNEETVSIILDLKNVEWGLARQTIHALILNLMFDYKFPHNYGYFFLSYNSDRKFIELAINNPRRLIDILDARANLQLAAKNRMKSLLEKTPKDLVEAETRRLNIAMTCFNYGSIFSLVIPGTEMNIHGALAQKICTEYNTELEKKYNNSLFYKIYTCIEFRDSLVWNKFTHAFRVWAVSTDESATTPQYKNLNKATLALITYVDVNKKIPEAIECFFNLNESPAICALFIEITSHRKNMEDLVYSELFKFKDHLKFTSIFKYLASNFKAPVISIFAKQVMLFVIKKPTNFGLILQLLTYNNSREVTAEFMEHVWPAYGKYDNFLAEALDNDSQLLICNLLSQRDPSTGHATMSALCRVAIGRSNFEPLYKLLGLIKSTKHKNWDPEADFIQYMLGSAAEQKDLPLIDAIITRCNPKITAGVLLAVSDSEKDNNEPVYQQIMKRITDEREKQLNVTTEESRDLIVDIKPTRILQRPKNTGV